MIKKLQYWWHFIFILFQYSGTLVVLLIGLKTNLIKKQEISYFYNSLCIIFYIIFISQGDLVEKVWLMSNVWSISKCLA